MGSPRLQLPPELARFCATPAEQPVDALPLDLPGLDAALPDGGLPRGCISELSTPAGLAHATRFGLAACASAQTRSREQRHDARSAWCAWLDPQGSLYAPGATAAGVDLTRLLVVRPAAKELARIAVRVVASGIFNLVIIDRCGIDGAGTSSRPYNRWRTATRRLALAASNSDCTVLLLSSIAVANRDRLPSALRLELTRPRVDQLSLRVVKERRGRTSGAISLPLQPPPLPSFALHIPSANTNA